MRKLFISLLAMLSLAAQAQKERLNYVGGSLGMWHEKTLDGTDKLNTTSIQVLPEFGYWKSEHWALGITLGFVQVKAKLEEKIVNYTQEITSTSRAFAVNPYARYMYFRKGIVGMFIDGGFGIGVMKLKELKQRTTTYEVGLRPGISLLVSDRVSLQGHLGFLGFRGDCENGVNEGGLSLDATEFTLGMVWNY